MYETLAIAAMLFVFVLQLRAQQRVSKRFVTTSAIAVGMIVLTFLAITAIRAQTSRPVFESIASHDLPSLRELLSARPSLANGRTWSGESALFRAVAARDIDAVNALIGAGADVDSPGHGRITPLHLAVEKGSIEIAHSLLTAGARVNVLAYKHNYTPLHVAAMSGNAPMCELLIQRGADRSIVDGNGLSASEVAANNGHSALATRLAP